MRIAPTARDRRHPERGDEHGITATHNDDQGPPAPAGTCSSCSGSVGSKGCHSLINSVEGIGDSHLLG